MRGRREEHLEDQILELQRDIANLQAQNSLQERQLERVLDLNPSAKIQISDVDPSPNPPSAMLSQLAKLLHDSALVRSYESLIGQYQTSMRSQAQRIDMLERES